MKYLLDTNLLSELVKKRPDSAVLARLRGCPTEELATAAVCVSELRFGALCHPEPGKLWSRIWGEILPRVRIVPFGVAEALRAGEIHADLAKRGQPIGVEDVQIAATAWENNLVVVTRNVRHFERIPALMVESWWQG